jgi:hypothetical protein
MIAACKATIEPVLQSMTVVCTPKDLVPLLQSAVNFATGITAVDVNSTLNSGSALQVPLHDHATQLDTGGFPDIQDDFGCPPVDHITVTPATATINEGYMVPLTASARDPSGVTLWSSAYNFTWLPSPNPQIASVTPAQSNYPFGIR